MTASLLLHLLAAMLWIGGMAFSLFALRPAAIATLQPPQRLPLMSAAMGHFFRLVTGAVVVLLATGLHLILASGGFAAARPGMHTMLGGALVMIVIFGYVAHGCYPVAAGDETIGQLKYPRVATAIARHDRAEDPHPRHARPGHHGDHRGD